jgi:4-hydroxybenzoate polyprenyltransferase
VVFGAAVRRDRRLYFTVALLYSVHLKHVVLLDVMTLAAGFVLRAVAGAVAIRVPISEWLLLCTALLALFLGLAKRRGELAALGDSPATRRILADYSIPLLDQMITIVASACVMAYSLYTFYSKTGAGRPYLMATIPFVIYGLFRYLYLSHRKGMGEAPETVLLEDRPLLINILLWVLTAVLVMLSGHR